MAKIVLVISGIIFCIIISEIGLRLGKRLAFNDIELLL